MALINLTRGKWINLSDKIFKLEIIYSLLALVKFVRPKKEIKQRSCLIFFLFFFRYSRRIKQLSFLFWFSFFTNSKIKSSLTLINFRPIQRVYKYEKIILPWIKFRPTENLIKLATLFDRRNKNLCFFFNTHIIISLNDTAFVPPIRIKILEKYWRS